MKFLLTSLIPIILLAAAATDCQAAMSDSFESGDLNAPYTTGLKWGGTNRTSLVTHDPVLGDVIVYKGNEVVEIQQGFDKQWTAKDGKISMRFDYPSGTNSWAEQRFSLDSAQSEVWISFWLKVPINFKHSSNSPSNNKLFALWMDGYSSKGAGPTVAWEFWNDGSGGSKLAYHYSPGGYRTANSHKQHTSFIRYPDDQGRWMQIVVYVKASTSASANNGIIQLYRRWSDETSFRKLHDDQNADIAPPSGGPNGWKAGYLMGWSNPGYREPTEWLLDDLIISRTTLLTTEPPPEPTQEPGPEPEPKSEPTPKAAAEPDDSNECKAPQVPVILN